MKKSTKITTAVVLSLGIIGASGAYAAKELRGDHEKRALHAVSYIASKLELDETQEQALSALKDQVLVVKGAMNGEVKTARADIQSLIEAESFDQGKALEMINAKTATVNSAAPDLVIAMGNFMDSLDSEQKQEIVEFMNSHKGKSKRGHWRH